MMSLRVLLSLSLGTLLAAAALGAQGGYDVAGLDAFRAAHAKTLLADNGWFTVAGLYFLNPGDNTFGSDPLLTETCCSTSTARSIHPAHTTRGRHAPCRRRATGCPCVSKRAKSDTSKHLEQDPTFNARFSF